MILRVLSARLIQKNIYDLSGEAATLRILSTILAMQERYSEACMHFREALLEAQDSGDRTVEAKVQFSFGDLYNKQNQYDSALWYYEQAEIYIRTIDQYSLEIGYHSKKVDVKHRIGDVHVKMKQYEEAVKHYKEALYIYGMMGNRLLEAELLIKIGDMYVKME
jgi:tetratricopeptide (TPR) repeat protein